MANKKIEQNTEVIKKVRIDEREQEWLDAFTKAGYEVSMGKKHIDMVLKGKGISIAIQKNSVVPYITFKSDEQLEGLEKIFAVKKYGYEIALPKKQSEKGDSRFRAVGHRTTDEIEVALEIIAKVVALKDATKPVKAEKPAKAEKSESKKEAPKKADKKPAEKKAPAKKATTTK